MLNKIINISLLENKLYLYVFSVLSFLAIYWLIGMIFKKVLNILTKKAESTINKFDDLFVEIVIKLWKYFALYASLMISTLFLKVDDSIRGYLTKTGLALIIISISYIGQKIIVFAITSYFSKRDNIEHTDKKLNGLIYMTKLLLWSFTVIFLLDNFGFKISSVITGLGIGGIAIALAAQVLLGDLFSYFAILFDKPFEIGDFIILENYMGTIEKIGIKTTRLRSLDGEQIIISNTTLTGSKLRNYKRMEKRRVKFVVGVTYSTSRKKITDSVEAISNIIKGIEIAEFDRCHFSSFADSSLILETVYYVKSGEYNIYMNTQQEINLKIMDYFEKEGIEFAFPTQTLYLKNN